MNNYDLYFTLNLNYKQLVMIFDEVKEEMRILLEFSLNRFKSSPEWAEIDASDRVMATTSQWDLTE